MSYDVELPTIEEILTDSPLTRSDASLTEYDDFEYTLIRIEDPPKVEVTRDHLVESINTTDAESVLASVDEEAGTAIIFHITEDTITQYSGGIGDGIHTLVDCLLCEDWFVLSADTTMLSEPVAEFFEEMTILPEGFAEQGELFTQTYARNQLKHRIYDIKQADEDIFGGEVDDVSEDDVGVEDAEQ